MRRQYATWLAALLLLAGCGIADQSGAAQPTPAAGPATSVVSTPVALAETAVRAELRATTVAPAEQPATNSPPCTTATPPERNDSGAEPTLCPPQPQPGPSVVAVAASPAARICPTPDRSDDHPPALPLPTRVAGALGCITATPNEAGGQTQGLTPTPIVGKRLVGLPSQGQTIELRVGETFELRLGEGMDWTVAIDNPRIVGPDAGALVPGSQGVYRALAAGSTRLTANGDPTCRKADPPCGAPSFLFEITIVVR